MLDCGVTQAGCGSRAGPEHADAQRSGAERGSARWGSAVTRHRCMARKSRQFLRLCRRLLRKDRLATVASTQALAYIRLLYDVEGAAKEQFQEQDPAALQRPPRGDPIRTAPGAEPPAPATVPRLPAWFETQP